MVSAAKRNQLPSQASLGLVEVATQPEHPKREATVQVEVCKTYTPASWVGEGGRSTCTRCALVEYSSSG